MPQINDSCSKQVYQHSIYFKQVIYDFNWWMVHTYQDQRNEHPFASEIDRTGTAATRFVFSNCQI